METAVRWAALANRLTCRWARALDVQGSTVFSGAGVWPLLGLLAHAADDNVRRKLEDAIGCSAVEARAMALHAVSNTAADLHVAARIWTHEGLPLEQSWTTTIPPALRGVLSGRAPQDRLAIDAWASQNTGGLVESLDVNLNNSQELSKATLLVAASAVAVNVVWTDPFVPGPMPVRHGPWRGRILHGTHRPIGQQDDVAVVEDSAAGPLTILTLRGKAEIDLCLVAAGPNHQAGAVVATACDLIANGFERTLGSAIPEGAHHPGLRVTTVRSPEREPRLSVLAPRFTVESTHDLLDQAELFGLNEAQDRTRGHFPGISSVPLGVNKGQQGVKASFSEEGFRAAAAAFVEMRFGSAEPMPKYKVRRLEVVLDRPFAFVAIHRPTGLLAFAGWVDDPEDYVESQDTPGNRYDVS